jgi:hypothetical protein
MQYPTDVIDHLVVSVEGTKLFMELGDSGDLPGEVSVEEVAVAGPAKQPWPDGQVVESAESFNGIDASSARHALGKPEQSLDASWPSLESVHGQWPEVVGEQPDRLDQREVGSRSRGGQQGEPHGDRASVGPMSEEPATRSANTLPVGPLSRRSKVLVGASRDVDVVERIGQFAWKGSDLRKMRVQD